MSLRPKTKRRLTQLTAGGAAAAGLAVAGVAYQLHRHEAARQHLRAEGMVAFEHGDYVRTLVELQKYLSDNRVDPKAIYTLAVARTNVPKPEQGHLVAARGLFVRYLELAPDDVDAQHRLLAIYQKLGYRHETDTMVEGLLARDPNDRAALAAKWESLAPQNPDAALAAALRLDGVDPTDVRTQEATLELMARLKREPGELVARAERLRAEHPNDPRFELVRAVAAHLTGDDVGTRQWLAAAAARPSPDGPFTLALAAAFDRTRQWPEAIAVLERAGPTAPVPVRLALVERLWYAGKTSAALDHLRDVVATDPRADVRLLGLKALLLEGVAGPADAMVTASATDPTSRPAEVDGIRSFLSARASDPTAAAWSALLRATDASSRLDPRQAVGITAAAARNDPDNAAARFFLGLAYLRLGEPALAMQTLAGASLLAPSWAAPQLLLARTLLDANQPTAAAAPARAAAARDPSPVVARTILAVIAYRTLPPRPTPAELSAVLEQVRAAQAADPTEARLSAAVVDLLVRLGRRAEAARVGVAAVNALAASPAAVHLLASVAAVDQLPEVSADVPGRVATLSTSTPADAFEVALALAAAGQTDRGRRLFADHPDDPAWQLADLRYREATAPSPALTDAWAALADANPTDLAVQRATLRSPAAFLGRALVDRTIDRLRTLTGDESVEWRLARARFQLADADGRPVGRDAASAVASSMAEVTRTVPHLAEPLLLWATALEQLGDVPGAIVRLRSAVPLAPDDPSVPLRLAHLLARTGQFRPAADAVDPLAAHAADLPPDVASDVADVYRRAGYDRRAVAVLQAASSGTSPDATRDVPLARSQAAAGDSRAAAATFDRVNATTPTADSLRAAAWFYAAAGDVERGRRVLAQLDAVPAVTMVQRDVIRGQFTATFGDPAAARSELEAVTRSSPDDPRSWAALAGFDLHAGDAAAAVVAADHGLTLAPDDASLSALRARARTVATLHLGPAAQPLLDALASDPTNGAAVATLDALASGSPDAAVATVAASYPAFVPAQALVIDSMVAAGRYDEAAAVAGRAADAAPADPAPERLLVNIWTAAGRPDAALQAAQRWRSRSRAAPRAADTAIASSLIRLGQPEQAAKQLAPYVQSASTDPATTEAYARALSAAGHADQSDAVLKPLAAGSAAWRRAWLSIVADTAPNAVDAARRIAWVASMVPAGSQTDAISIASAWYTAGGRFGDATAARRGLDALAPVAKGSDVPTDALVLLGALHQQLDDLPAAESAYRRALAGHANLPRAMNNLAWVIVLRDGDVAEARSLADRAVALVPADADLRTTLGQVALKQGDVPAATEAFRTATRLSPRSAAAWAGLADAQARAGHTGDAADALNRAEQLLAPPAPPPSAATAAELKRARAALGRPSDAGPRTVRPVG